MYLNATRDKIEREYQMCLDLELKNIEAGMKEMACFWRGKAEGMRFILENADTMELR